MLGVRREMKGGQTEKKYIQTERREGRIKE